MLIIASNFRTSCPKWDHLFVQDKMILKFLTRLIVVFPLDWAWIWLLLRNLVECLIV